MKTFFSALTGGLYPEGMLGAYEAAGTLPNDIKEIPKDRLLELLAAIDAGASIEVNSNGDPVACFLPPLTDDQIADFARAERDRRLKDCDWVSLRAVDTGVPVPLEWVAYRQTLRDVPEQVGFPQSIDWPVSP